MPKRTDIQSILVIGAGPIIVGQACEFDYSGTQACKTLKAEGYRVILINSNPATIMTDPELADATYIEPITPAIVEKIIAAEKPDALLPTLGGQMALDTTMALFHNGALKRHNVTMLGATPEAIDKAENRALFARAMRRIGLECPASTIINGDDNDTANTPVNPHTDDKRRRLSRALAKARDLIEISTLPLIIRPSFTLGGKGGGIAYNRDEFLQIIENGLHLSPTTEVLVEESVLGWKEYEMEVIRDKADNAVIICSIENVDPMGIHTGDSVTVAPALTLTDRDYQRMRTASLEVLREIGIETGGSNVQFAVDPKSGRMLVIEMNPRVSRSSALASKATGYPIAKIATLLAIGYTLDELQNDMTKVIPASFEPTLDYVVTKIPRFAFEKFPDTPPLLTTAMKSIGEVMAIGRCFEESLQKALCSLEIGLTGLDELDLPHDTPEQHRNAIIERLQIPTADRLRTIADAFRLGIDADEIHQYCRYDPWFIERIGAIVAVEQQLRGHPLPRDPHRLTALKALGFSDARLASLSNQTAQEVAQLRAEIGVTPVYKRIDGCSAEFAALTPYLYSTYEHPPLNGPRQCEVDPSPANKIIILGSGPNRIGQGIEFDYCCCHAAFALTKAGFETIMVNCNPETVSTDYDTADRLYFEPLTDEHVIALIRRESQNGRIHGVIVQLGGQTPLKLAAALAQANIPILGTPLDQIDRAEDRDRFSRLLDQLGLTQPIHKIAHNVDSVRQAATEIGYPVILRPSYVLGGRAMEIIWSENQLDRYVTEAVRVSGDEPVLIDSYLQDAIEVDVDALADGHNVHICGVMEHIEKAGIHSGDSACVLPPHRLAPAIIAEIRHQTTLLAKALNVVGLMNVQFAIVGQQVYVLEVNPRASRTVPFVSKALPAPIAGIAAQIMAGALLVDFSIPEKPSVPVSVKEAVFSFSRFPGSDVLLGPEMRSTGEVMGLAYDFPTAFAKSQIAAGAILPHSGTVFISVKPSDKEAVLPYCRMLAEHGFKLCATSGTADFLRDAGLEIRVVNKIRQGRPNIVDDMKNGMIQLAINTPANNHSASGDSRAIRRVALQEGIPYYTTRDGIAAVTEAIIALTRNQSFDPVSLQAYNGRTCPTTANPHSR